MGMHLAPPLRESATLESATPRGDSRRVGIPWVVSGWVTGREASAR